MALADRLGRLNDACQRHHGETVTYTPAAGSPVEVQGIYVKRPLEVDLGDGAVSTVEHRVDVRAADISGGPKRGATVEVRGIAYRVERVDGPDDSGVCVLQLLMASSP